MSFLQLKQTRQPLTPTRLMGEIALNAYIGVYGSIRTMQPGEFLERKVSPEHREILKNLKPEHIQEMPYWLCLEPETELKRRYGFEAARRSSRRRFYCLGKK